MTRDDPDQRPGTGDDSGTPDRGDPPDVPPPATWAGRALGAGEGDQAEPAADGEGSEPAEGPAGEAEAPGEPDGLESPAGELEQGGESAQAQGFEALGDDGEPAVVEEPLEPVPDQPTVEIDTLLAADREQAEEAALAGLRARAAGRSPEPDEPEPEPDAPEPVLDQPTPEPVASLAAPPPAPEPAPKRRALWPRFLVASLLIVVSMATATSVSALLLLASFAEAINPIPEVQDFLEPVGGGDPQTILILGSDERLGPQEPGGARSDTAILLRIDPDRDAIGLLSIPRDLRVDFADMGVEGLGVERFNAAYAHGGPRLTLRTVKRLTGLEVNHVVNINFTGFADAVNAIDCVFIDVDRRYYVPEGSGYAAIDPPIEAGYQRLCGLKALQYVRFRHDDNDLVRAARQQDFLREARQKIPPSKLWADRNELMDIFTSYTSSDEALKSPIQILELLKTFLAARDANVNEIHFPAELGGPDDPYVTASRGAIAEAVDLFMGTEGTPGPKPGSTPKDEAPERGEGGGGQGGGDRERPRPEPDPEPAGPQMADAGPVAEAAREIAAQTTPSGMRTVLDPDFPIFYPTAVPARTSFNPIAASRAFPIDGPGDEVYGGYKIVLSIPGGSGFSEYWGISGTDWSDPPILENPSETRPIDGRRYLLFYDGDRLRLVGFKQGGRSYWVNNTLMQSLEEAEMLATAQAMSRLER